MYCSSSFIVVVLLKSIDIWAHKHGFFKAFRLLRLIICIGQRLKPGKYCTPPGNSKKEEGINPEKKVPDPASMARASPLRFSGKLFEECFPFGA